MINKTISHYQILEKLGEGGMGVVYKAHDTKLDRLVALKFLPHHLDVTDSEKARFLQEARAASAVTHPNVCIIYDIVEEGEEQFIVMECVEGKTLRQLIPLQKTQDAITYALQIGEALQEAHSKGIVHRDIKADNIMVNTKNQIKVMDFGLAKLKGSLKLTKTSSTVGTLAYMAPEQIQGGEVDARSDIFSFGVVLYEMLTGHLPFRGEHEAAMMYSILNEEPEPIQKYIPEVSSEMMHIFNRALEKEPEDRYQSVQEMLIDLRRIKKQTSRVTRVLQVIQPTQTTVDSFREPSKETKKILSKKTILIGVGIFAILAVIITYVFLPRKTVELNPNMVIRDLTIPFKQIGLPGISSDGNWVAFPAADENDKWDIYIIHATGGEPRRVTSDFSNVYVLTDISPDGSQIVYDRYNPETRKREICLVASTGGSGRVLTDGFWNPRWRQDGKCIGFFAIPEQSKSKKYEFWTINIDGSSLRQEFVDSISLRAGQMSFDWSPDGKTIAWLRTYPERHQEIILHNLETGQERQLTDSKKIIGEVTWIPNDIIIYSTNVGGSRNLWFLPSSGGTPVQLTRGTGPDFYAKSSAEGRRLVFSQKSLMNQLWMVNSDGTNNRQLTVDEGLHEYPSISPDGKFIAYGLRPGSGIHYARHIHIISRDGKERREVTREDEVTYFPTWSPDGKWLSFTSRLITEPQDSFRAYYIDAHQQAVRRFIDRGWPIMWIDLDRLLIRKDMRTYIVSLNGTEKRQFYRDSTPAFPILNNKWIIYTDFRNNSSGTYIIRADDSTGHSLKKITQPIFINATDSEGKFFLYSKKPGEIWKVYLPDLSESRLPGKFPKIEINLSFHLGRDGKEFLYTKPHSIGKLVIIENPFR